MAFVDGDRTGGLERIEFAEEVGRGSAVATDH